MFKVLFIFAIGLSVGYFAGFKDARTHEQDVVARMVGRAGGSHRENIKTDVDKEMMKLER